MGNGQWEQVPRWGNGCRGTALAPGRDVLLKTCNVTRVLDIQGRRPGAPRGPRRSKGGRILRPVRSRNNLLGLLGLILVLSTAISGCGTAAQMDQPVAQAAPITLELPVDVDARTVDRVRSRDDVVILDVREDWEYAGGHVPDAMWIPLGQLPDRLDEIPQDKTVVAVCRSGNRSGQATQLLRQKGFTAHNMLGGMISWEQAGLEIEK